MPVLPIKIPRTETRKAKKPLRDTGNPLYDDLPLAERVRYEQRGTGKKIPFSELKKAAREFEKAYPSRLKQVREGKADQFIMERIRRMKERAKRLGLKFKE